MSEVQPLEELQRVLAEKIKRLDEERQKEREEIAREREDERLLAEAERAERLRTIKAGEEKARQREITKAQEEQDRLKKETEARVSLEQKENELAEKDRLYKEKLEWLEKAISEAEFQEEKHKKDLENSRTPVPVSNGDTQNINVEYPEAPLNGGEAVIGTDGTTPDTPLMSQHLKSILRQAQRSY